MTSLRRALAGIGALAVVVGAAVVALIVSGYYELRWVSVAFAVLGGFGFVGAGLYAWSRRPDRKVGALMTLTGFAWFAAMCTASDNAVVFSLAVYFGNVFAAVLMHLLLAYPDGELHTRGDRITVWAGVRDRHARRTAAVHAWTTRSRTARTARPTCSTWPRSMGWSLSAARC